MGNLSYSQLFTLTTSRAFNIGEFVDGKADQPLPATIQSREDEIARFFSNCHKLCNQILKLFAVALEVRVRDLTESKHANNRHDSGKRRRR